MRWFKRKHPTTNETLAEVYMNPPTITDEMKAELNEVLSLCRSSVTTEDDPRYMFTCYKPRGHVGYHEGITANKICEWYGDEIKVG